MSALGDLLELMHQAPRRCATVRLELRQWQHLAPTGRAMEGEAERPGGLIKSPPLESRPASRYETPFPGLTESVERRVNPLRDVRWVQNQLS